MSRARLRLWNPKLFNQYRTQVLSNGDVHFVWGRDRKGDWYIQSITFLYPSKRFPSIESIYNWYQYHKTEKMRTHEGLKIEYGGKTVFGGLEESEPLHIQRLKAQRQIIPTFIVGSPYMKESNGYVFRGIGLEYFDELSYGSNYPLVSLYGKKTTSPDIEVYSSTEWKWNFNSYNDLDTLIKWYSVINLQSTYEQVQQDYYRTCKWYATLDNSTKFTLVYHNCGSWWKINP